MTITFELCCRICHEEGSGKPGWIEIKWQTSAFVYADDFNILGGSIHTIKKTQKEAVVVVSKGIGLEVNADKTKYIFMSRSECRSKAQFNI